MFGGTSIFGGAAAPAMPTFGSTFAAPAAATPQPFTFGAQAPQTTFAATPAPTFAATPTFGATATPGGIFAPAASATPTSGIFGLRTATAGVGTMGQPTTALFGATSPQQGGVFGATGAFGAVGFNGVMKKGTGDPKFAPSFVKDGAVNMQYHSITMMDQYNMKSFEELRFEDYCEGRKGGTVNPFGQQAAAAAPAGGIFATQPQQQQQQQQQQSPFGALGQPSALGGLFGGTAQPAATAPSLFGTTGAAPAATGGLFATGTTPSIFGGTTAPSLFATSAAATPAFGATAPAATGGLFGGGSLLGGAAPGATSSLFSTGSALGAPSTGGLFATQPTATTSLFGTTGGGLGAPSTPALGSFTLGTGTSLFGNTAAAATPSLSFTGAGTTGSSLFSMPSAQPSFTGSSLFSSPTGGIAGLGAGTSSLFNTTMTGATVPQGQALVATADQNPYGALPSMAITKENDAALLALRGAPAKKLPKLETHYKLTPRSSARIQPRAYGPPRSMSMYSDPATASALTSASQPELYTSRLKLVMESQDMPVVTPSPLPPKGKKSSSGSRSTDPAPEQGIPATPYLPMDASRGGVPTLKITAPESTPAAAKDKGKDKDNTDNASADPADSQYRITHRVVPTPKKPTPGTVVRDPFANPSALNGDQRDLEPSDDDDEMLQTADPSSSSYSQVSRSHGFAIKKVGDEAAAHNSAPKLTSPGYYTDPSMEELLEMTDEELAHVKDFVVGRKGFGRVHFHGETDVRGLDLDAIVAFHKQQVEVYPADGQAPPVGQGLNKPATITLEKCWPRDKNTNTIVKDERTNPRLMQRFRKRLEMASNGSVFDYNMRTGEWTFDVPHF